jgi:hypothetical protein
VKPILITSFLAAMAFAGAALAQPSKPAAKVDAAAAQTAKAGGLGDPEADAMAATSRKRAQERERAWERRMRDTVRGICTGC